MRPALAIFVKTLGRSAVKTRLAAAVGRENAERFYRLSIAAIEAVVRSCGPEGPIPYWAVAETDAVADPLWRSFEAIAQGTGGLGERLDRVYRSLLDRHGSVLLAGADGPLLGQELIETAISSVEVETITFAISRSSDGGYGLFAGRRALPAEVWTAVPYSCDRTAEEFLARLRPFGKVAELPPLDDVDEFADLHELVRSSAGRRLLPEQAAVVDFARELVRFPGRG